MNSRLKGFLQLCRPANLPTAASDVLAGLALAGFFLEGNQTLASSVWLLPVSSIFLYAGGVVLNDVFDFELDKLERPERPIPTGVIKLSEAKLFASILLILGVGTAFIVSLTSGIVASSLCLLIISYDGFSKTNTFLGPLNMGLCRGFNLLLGISAFGLFLNLEYMILPIIYIAAITMVSQGEVNGNNKKNISIAFILYALVVALILYFHFHNAKVFFSTYIFLLVFVLAIGLPLIRAYQSNTPINIKKAVKAGVISIILMDALIAVPFSDIWVGIGILLLLPISLGLAKAFAVT